MQVEDREVDVEIVKLKLVDSQKDQRKVRPQGQ